MTDHQQTSANVQGVEASAADDPYLWLEEIDSPQVRAWVEARNAETVSALCDAQFENDMAAVLDVLNAPDRIAWVRQRGSLVYNFWQDAEHRKGLWRRTTLLSYRSENPDWEILLDVDQLAKSEAEDWVWRGCATLAPEHRRGLVHLSRGGADAVVIREFDLAEKHFVDGGLYLSEAKGGADWVDENTLLVSSRPGRRGLSDHQRICSHRAPLPSRYGIRGGASRVRMQTRRHGGLGRPRPGPALSANPIPAPNRFRAPRGFRRARRLERIKLDIPADASVSVDHDWLVFNLRTEWDVGGRRYPAGALLIIALSAFLAGARDFTVLFEPSPRRFLQSFGVIGDVVAMIVLDNVRSLIFLARFAEGRWTIDPVEGFSDLSILGMFALAADDDDWFADNVRERGVFVVTSQNILTPPTLSLLRFGQASELLKQSPATVRRIGP